MSVLFSVGSPAFVSLQDGGFLETGPDPGTGIALVRGRMEGRMANSNVDGQKNSGVFQMFPAFGGGLFRFLHKIGIVRTGGTVDTWDD
jgi:hypothetical protein